MRIASAPTRSSRDGRIGAHLLINDEGRAGIRLRVSRGDGVSDYKGLSLPQAVAIVEVLDSALRDIDRYMQSDRVDRYIAKALQKRRAASGRATALVHIRDNDQAIISLGIGKAANRFDHVELRPAEARSVLDVVAQVLRDAEAHRAGEGV